MEIHWAWVIKCDNQFLYTDGQSTTKHTNVLRANHFLEEEKADKALQNYIDNPDGYPEPEGDIRKVYVQLGAISEIETEDLETERSKWGEDSTVEIGSNWSG